MRNVKNVLEDTKVKEKARQNKVYCIKNKSMRIKTLIKTFIEKKAQLMEVMIEDTNTDYFINKIEKNLNNKLTCLTNVKGEMTDWNFFNKDKNFHDVLKKGLHNSKIKYPELSLQDSWGIKLLKNQQTTIKKPRNLQALRTPRNLNTQKHLDSLALKSLETLRNSEAYKTLET